MKDYKKTVEVVDEIISALEIEKLHFGSFVQIKELREPHGVGEASLSVHEIMAYKEVLSFDQAIKAFQFGLSRAQSIIKNLAYWESPEKFCFWTMKDSQKNCDTDCKESFVLDSKTFFCPKCGRELIISINNIQHFRKDMDNVNRFIFHKKKENK